MEPLDLSSRLSVMEHRNALLERLPGMLGTVAAHDQIRLLQQGRYGEVVGWFTGYVSTGAHGANGGDFGLTEAQTLDFNPYAREVGLIAPVRLWTPGDNRPQGARVGDFVEYSVTPDFQALPQNVREAPVTVAIDATADGTIGRIDTMLGTATHSAAPNAKRLAWWRNRGQAVVLTGMRAVKRAEGATGMYKEFLPEGVAQETPIEQAFPSATDVTLAILRKRCSKFELIHEEADPQAGKKDEDHTHPALGGRTWIARYYDAVDATTGKKLLITVVNGEPIAATSSELNRSRTEPAPRAGDTLGDYLRLRLSGVESYVMRKLKMRELTGPVDMNLAISYAHLGRIAAELIKKVGDNQLAASVGSVSLVGNMPQLRTWQKIVDGWKHNGGTLGFKEIYPYIKALNALLGLDPRDLRTYR